MAVLADERVTTSGVEVRRIKSVRIYWGGVVPTLELRLLIESVI